MPLVRADLIQLDPTAAKDVPKMLAAGRDASNMFEDDDDENDDGEEMGFDSGSDAEEDGSGDDRVRFSGSESDEDSDESDDGEEAGPAARRQVLPATKGGTMSELQERLRKRVEELKAIRGTKTEDTETKKKEGSQKDRKRKLGEARSTDSLQFPKIVTAAEMKAPGKRADKRKLLDIVCAAVLWDSCADLCGRRRRNKRT